MQQTNNDRSLGDLFGDLARDMGTLVSQEMTLARTEVAETATRVGRISRCQWPGGLVAYAGLLAIIAAVIFLIADRGVPLWLSALVVGAIVAAIGCIVVQRGITR